MKDKNDPLPFWQVMGLHSNVSRKLSHEALIHHLRQTIILRGLHWWFVLTREERSQEEKQETLRRLYINWPEVQGEIRLHTNNIPDRFYLTIGPAGISREWYIKPLDF